MSSVLISLIVFVGVTWSAIVQAEKPDSDLDYFHVSGSQRVLTSTELWLLGHFQTWFRQHERSVPVLDSGLGRAAKRLAERLAHQPVRELPHHWVQTALWLSGRGDQRVQIFAMVFRDRAHLHKQLKQQLASVLAGQRPNTFGLAVAKHRVQVCVIIASRRGLQLQALARWWRVGDNLKLEGRLLPGFKQPRIVIGLPDQSVLQPSLKLRKDGYFVAHWTVSMSGNINIQLLVTDNEGPWISENLELWAISGSQIPLLFRRHIRQRYLGQLWQKISTTTKLAAKRPLPQTKIQDSNTAVKQLFKLINELRAKHSLRPLHRHPGLDALALSHARDMVAQKYFAHTSPRWGSFEERFGSLHWQVTLTRENIVVARSAEEAHRLLYDSPAHRANLLEPRFSFVGIGVALNQKGELFFVQVFVAE
jgi:uncharacterized protein YkwD